VSADPAKAGSISTLELLLVAFIVYQVFTLFCLLLFFLDTSGTVRKTGGNFKEKLRELGGLDAVFELAVKFLYTLEV